MDSTVLKEKPKEEAKPCEKEEVVDLTQPVKKKKPAVPTYAKMINLALVAMPIASIPTTLEKIEAYLLETWPLLKDKKRVSGSIASNLGRGVIQGKFLREDGIHFSLVPKVIKERKVRVSKKKPAFVRQVDVEGFNRDLPFGSVALFENAVEICEFAWRFSSQLRLSRFSLQWFLAAMSSKASKVPQLLVSIHLALLQVVIQDNAEGMQNPAPVSDTLEAEVRMSSG